MDLCGYFGMGKEELFLGRIVKERRCLSPFFRQIKLAPDVREKDEEKESVRCVMNIVTGALVSSIRSEGLKLFRHIWFQVDSGRYKQSDNSSSPVGHNQSKWNFKS